MSGFAPENGNRCKHRFAGAYTDEKRDVSDLRLRITDEAKTFVEYAAYEDGVQPPDLVQKALDAYRYLRKVRSEDGELVLRRSDGTLERIANF